MDNEPKYSIKAISRITGLSAHLIRAWERRYGVTKPVRTETNRRLYTVEDAAKLRLLAKAVSMGLSIGSVAGLSSAKLKSIVNMNEPAVELPEGPPDSKTIFLTDSIEAIMDYKQEGLRNILLKASIDLSQKELLNLLVIPLINYLGDTWQKGSLRIAQEHMASSVIASFLQYLRGIYKNRDDSPHLISATLPGELHELGALIVSSVAASEGWKVTHLGSNLPVDEIISTSAKTSAKVICLSLVCPGNEKDTISNLKILNNITGYGTRIIIGGRAARTYINAIRNTKILLVEDINEFRDIL